MDRTQMLALDLQRATQHVITSSVSPINSVYQGASGETASGTEQIHGKCLNCSPHGAH